MKCKKCIFVLFVVIAAALFSSRLWADEPVPDNEADNSTSAIHLKWTGNVTVAANLQSGNTDRTNASVGADAVRKTVQDRYSLKYLFNYAEEDDATTARNTYGTGKYDHFFTEKYYGYLSAELLNDEFKDLNLRTVVGPGAGYQIWDDQVKELLVEGGVSYFSEDLDEGKDDDWITGRVSGDLKYTYREKIVIGEQIIIYPALEDTGEFQLRNEVSLSSALYAGWSLKLANILEYDSEPPEDVDKSDWNWLLGLQYGF